MNASITPGLLVKEVAAILAVPEKTVTTYYTYLRKSGLMTVGGRGTSAPKSTVQDMWTLVIAIIGAPDICSCVEPTQRLLRGVNRKGQSLIEALLELPLDTSAKLRFSVYPDFTTSWITRYSQDFLTWVGEDFSNDRNRTPLNGMVREYSILIEDLRPLIRRLKA